MEPLTHTLVGLALARSGLGRRTPFAGAALVAGANLPDLDALVYLLADRDLGLGFRRGVTHGLPAVIVLPWLLGLGLWLLARRRGAAGASWGELGALAFLAAATHPLLDWLNNYGMRWFSPFDDRWSYGDAVFIADPWLWLLLGGGAFLASSGASAAWRWSALAAGLTLLVLGLGHGRGPVPTGARWAWCLGLLALALTRRFSRPDERARERMALLGLAGAGLYVAVMLALAHAGRAVVLARLAPELGRPISDLMVAPTAADPTRWEVVARTDAAIVHGRLTWGKGPRLEVLGRLETAPDSPVVEAARRAPAARGLMAWARYPYFEVEQLADGWRVHILDARYVRARRPGFGGAAVRLDRDLRPVAGP